MIRGNQILSIVRSFSTTPHVCRSSKVNYFDLNFDRRLKVDYTESIKYMESEAFKRTYKGLYVWQQYRRNHKGQWPRENTRPDCVNAEGFLDTSNPCVICRDEYLVLHPENRKLLEQFIDPYTGKVLSRKVHGLCLKQYRNLLISIIKAKDAGTITYELPDRYFDYKEYYG